MSTRNICFMEKYWIIFLNYHQIPSLSISLSVEEIRCVFDDI